MKLSKKVTKEIEIDFRKEIILDEKIFVWDRGNGGSDKGFEITFGNLLLLLTSVQYQDLQDAIENQKKRNSK
jgi:hypothetical protein